MYAEQGYEAGDELPVPFAHARHCHALYVNARAEAALDVVTQAWSARLRATRAIRAGEEIAVAGPPTQVPAAREVRLHDIGGNVVRVGPDATCVVIERGVLARVVAGANSSVHAGMIAVRRCPSGYPMAPGVWGDGRTRYTIHCIPPGDSDIRWMHIGA